MLRRYWSRCVTPFLYYHLHDSSELSTSLHLPTPAAAVAVTVVQGKDDDATYHTKKKGCPSEQNRTSRRVIGSFRRSDRRTRRISKHPMRHRRIDLASGSGVLGVKQQKALASWNECQIAKARELGLISDVTASRAAN